MSVFDLRVGNNLCVDLWIVGVLWKSIFTQLIIYCKNVWHGKASKPADNAGGNWFHTNTSGKRKCVSYTYNDLEEKFKRI